jgi:hypothetical protein
MTADLCVGRGVPQHGFTHAAGFDPEPTRPRPVASNRAVSYEVTLAENGRAYLGASFTPQAPATAPCFDELLAGQALRVLALDLNHGFLAPGGGRPGGQPRLPHIPLVTEDLPA